MQLRELTVVVPALNEALRIGASITKLLEGLPGRVERFEIVVVDDGSTDGTGELVERDFAAHGDRVRVVRHANRTGKGAAIRSGVNAARYAWTLMVDADMSIPLRELDRLVPHTRVAPLVIGSKRAPGNDIDYPEMRRLLGGVGQLLISLAVVRGFHDTQCGFKLYRTDIARELFAQGTIDGFGYDFEILFLARRAGYAVAEEAVRVDHQLGSSVRLSSYLNVFGEVLRLNLNRLRGVYPPPRGRND